MYTLKNQPFQREQESNSETVKFNTLTHGSFKYSEKGNISTVVKRDEESITLKKHDGWLVTVLVGEVGWDKDVIVVEQSLPITDNIVKKKSNQ